MRKGPVQLPRLAEHRAWLQRALADGAAILRGQAGTVIRPGDAPISYY